MSTETVWWLTLGLGLVVALVAIALLQTFLSRVRRIERVAEQIWEMGKRVASNTSTTWMLGETSEALDLLADEVGRHEELLRTVGGE